MLTQVAHISRLVLARLNPGDDVLASVRAVVEQNDIRSGLVVGGVGSLNRYRVHVVDRPDLPTRDAFFEAEGPVDILSVNGLILDGRVHAHITFSDTRQALGGHLEEGCRILTFGVVVLAETPDAEISGWDRVGSI